MQKKEITGYPSLDQPWLKYFSNEALKTKTPECTFYRNILQNNKAYPNETAIRYYNNEISYGKMFENIDLCAKALKQIGIKVGDCVTLCTAGVPEAIFLVLACSKIGAIANFINPVFTTEQMVARINETEAQWIFVLDEMYSFVKEALPETCIKNVVVIPAYLSMPNPLKALVQCKGKTKKVLKTKTGLKITHWNSFLKKGTLFFNETEASYQKNTPAIMVYSSGSTGASKGILLTNESVNAVIDTYCKSNFDFQRDDSFLQIVPVWFSTGIVLSVLMPLFFGITVIPEPVFGNESFAKDLLKQRPSLTVASTSMWLYVLDNYNNKKIDFSKMKYPISGGERLLPQDEERINKYLKEHGFRKKLYKGYGMCELGSEATGTTDAENYIDRPGGSGYPMKNVIVAAFDPLTNKELKYEEHGEIRVCTPARMKCYYKNETATNDFFYTDDKGRVWGRTGDIGYVDKNGEIFILGRATDSAILENNKTVYLFDVESVILEDEMLSGCKVVAKEEGSRTVLIAHLTVKNGYTFDEKELAQKVFDNCKRQLPKDEVPVKIKFHKAFPLHNGKQNNAALKQETEGFIEI